MEHCSILQSIIDEQPEATRAAIADLEHWGLEFGTHFGYQNAEDILFEMHRAISENRVTEWLRDRCGVVTS